MAMPAPDHASPHPREGSPQPLPGASDMTSAQPSPMRSPDPDEAALERDWPELLERCEGRFVLYSAGRRVGDFGTFDEAYDYALDHLGWDAKVLIEEVSRVPETVDIPAFFVDPMKDA